MVRIGNQVPTQSVILPFKTTYADEAIGYYEKSARKCLPWQKGLEKIEFLKTGVAISFSTRTETGGLGEGFDLLIIDEEQEYTDAQESALKYVFCYP